MVIVRGAVALTLATSAGAATAATVNVNTTGDATSLVNTLLGEGISLVGTPTLSGGNGVAGTFSNGVPSGIGIGSGVLLTTGSAADAAGPNDTASETTSHDIDPQNDSDLQELVENDDELYDITVLEFDFTTEGGDLFFNYAFASEEYNEFVTQGFNDVFGFFLDGENIALLPNGDPISIDTVNADEQSALFNNNEGDVDEETDEVTGAPFDLQYDGFTDVLTAQALGLSAGTHTIRLAIADVGDSSYDSAVFLQAGSFTDEEPTPGPGPGPGPGPNPVIPTPAALPAGLLLAAAALLRRRTVG